MLGTLESNMSGLDAVRDWFAGNGRYMTLTHCMAHDYLWIAITVGLDLAVAGGYVLIALHWWRNQRLVPASPAKRALGNLRNIFLFCGVCGYAFIPVKMVWPAWRLYDFVMLALAYYTWRYAWGARELKVVYTELKRSTQLAQDLKASREESRRKSFFLNAVSHDLRTPLNGLLLQSSLAEHGVAAGDTETVRAAVREIQAGARAAGELLDGLLEYARLESGAERPASAPVDMGEVVDSVIAASATSAAQKGLSLRAHVPVGLTVTADRRRLERVLSNLVTNAVKFTDQGNVRVEVERRETSLRVHVVDTGIGIAPEHRERLFEEFFQVNNAERNRSKGFGLGLAIARRLARQMGGELTVESSPGHGSRFTLALPLDPASASTQSAVEPPTSPLPLAVEPAAEPVVN
jgi:signal transduction histidine kinase